MFNNSIYYFPTDDEAGDDGDTQSQPRVTDSGDSSSVPGVSGIIRSSCAPPLLAADACPTGRALTRAVLESQEEIVRAIGGINDRLDRYILRDISKTLNVLVNK